MKKYLIKIDPRSIKENPKSSSNDCIAIPGKHQVTEKRAIMHCPGYYVIETWFGSGVEDGKLKGGVLVSVSEPQFHLVKPNNSISIETPVQYLYTFDAFRSRFTYDYLPTMVKCQYCNAEFMHTEFLDEFYCGDYPGYDLSCAICGQWYCCDVEYDRPTDAELEKRMREWINQISIE